MSLAEQEAALDVRYPAPASQVPVIRRAVGEVPRGLGAGDDVLLQIDLAVSEAATNAIGMPTATARSLRRGTCASSCAGGFDDRLVVYADAHPRRSDREVGVHSGAIDRRDEIAQRLARRTSLRKRLTSLEIGVEQPCGR